MSWYAAHVVLYVQFKDGVQNKVPVWENVLLVEAESPKKAHDKALELGRQSEGDSDGSFHWEERPATWVLAGVRKVVACEDESHQPRNGTELSYFELELDSIDSLQRMMKGEPVHLKYEEID